MNRNKNRASSLGKSVLKRKIDKLKRQLAKEETITDDILEQILSMAMTYNVDKFMDTSIDHKLLNVIINWKRTKIEQQKLTKEDKDIDDTISDYPED